MSEIEIEATYQTPVITGSFDSSKEPCKVLAAILAVHNSGSPQ